MEVVIPDLQLESIQFILIKLSSIQSVDVTYRAESSF